MEYSDSMSSENVGENYPCGASDEDETRVIFLESRAYSL
jgi:hypothetical protein